MNKLNWGRLTEFININVLERINVEDFITQSVVDFANQQLEKSTFNNFETEDMSFKVTEEGVAVFKYKNNSGSIEIINSNFSGMLKFTRRDKSNNMLDYVAICNGDVFKIGTDKVSVCKESSLEY